MTFDKAVGPNVDELKERWPLNDEGKRIYTDDKGFQWELNTIRLNVWAAHMVRHSHFGLFSILSTSPIGTRNGYRRASTGINSI